MPRFHGNVRALQLVVLLGDVNFIGNHRLLTEALIIDGGFCHIWLHVFKAAQMTTAFTTIAHTEFRIMVIKVGI